MQERIIATVTNDDLGLIEETEIIGASQQLKEIFVELGMAKIYDDTKPIPPKGLNEYEPGLSYPKDRFIINNNNLYKSNCDTSTMWNPLEWDIKITGANTQ